MADKDPPIDVSHVPASEGADRLSQILLAVAASQEKERISVYDLLAALRHRAIGALMFIFAVPNVLPMPPGASGILGAPLVFLAAQLMLGLDPWLPKFIGDRSLSRVDFERVVARVAPWLAQAERLMKPRWEYLARPPAEYIVGAVCLLMSIVLFLPIPLGNMLPAFTICVLALGVLERDGLWVVLGIGCSVVAVAVVWGVLWAMIFGALFLVRRFIGI